MHLQVAKDHGFTEIANVIILDADESMTLTVEGGVQLKETYVGSHFTDYDSYLVLSHFKGHPVGGFGGAIKNIGIGIASREGKIWIHSGGDTKTNENAAFLKNMAGIGQNEFLEAMAETAKAISDNLDHGKNIVYVNVMNRLSVDCDCLGNPAEPDMHDIGILASTDPVALDQACVDLVYAAEDGASLVKRMESRNGIHTLEYAEDISLGSRKYDLVSIDG